MNEDEVNALLRGHDNFAENIYQSILPYGGNIFFSPLSAHMLLTLISQDPGYHNKEAFTGLLRIFELDLAAEYYKKVLGLLQTSNTGTLTVGNKAFLRDNCQLQEVFNILLTNNFSYEVQSLDLSKHDFAVKSINAWVEDKTNRKIKDLVDSRSLIDSTRLVLVNTMNLNDKWAVPFNVDNTVQATFYLNNNDTVDIQMMRSKREVYYKSDSYLNAKVLELPFNNNDLSLVIVLPNKETTIAILEDNLRGWDLVNITDNMSKQEVDISLPKFKIDYGLALSEELDENAQLFGMIDNDEFLCFDKIQKKAFIDVNEEGIQATSGVNCTSVPSKNDEEGAPKTGLIIYEMDVKSNISNRFAKNLVVCKVKNTEKSAKEATFTVTLPETAFITEFIMELGGKSYKSYIKEKQEAKNIYNKALASGQSAGIVEASARDSNEFTVSVNLEPQSVAVFLLTYEEMLQCIHDQYELVLNIRPGQIVDNLNVEVTINESRPLKFIETPPLRSGNELNKIEKFLKPSTDIKILNTKTAVVKFSPDSKQQIKFARYLGTSISNGFCGQFIVQYSVERDPQGGEILLQDGYFVHFFAPNDLDPLPKHVVFVLDTSGSMNGRKISQLKDAMMSILNEIRQQDIISIVEFNSHIIVWDVNTERSTSFFYENYQDPFCSLSEFKLPDPTYASDVIINKAKNVIRRLSADGGTFMIGGLQIALRLVTRLNFNNNKVAIFSLSFGNGADKSFLRKLSLENLGFSRHIYEASDASLQLQAFYKQISSPLLFDITFKYESEVKNVTKTRFPIYFRGSELIVSGIYEGSNFPASINCCGSRGRVILKSVNETPVTSLERLWAYLTVKQLLEERDSAEEKTELTKKAVDLALKYSFVTEVTSLVVVKPDETHAVTTGEDDTDSEFKAAGLYHEQ
ncbi:hypothetical protein NQ314_015222 [Rhamnusium bicolor]|uniref:Uncharacterized protein n=1 Tax=Rhamnusium bicolor TaxID=1586634 RepID=A0AAV8X1L8_9CUCU|nr:hypothetical protein NQ314_015222 [Rhamnusium bicolor]